MDNDDHTRADGVEVDESCPYNRSGGMSLSWHIKRRGGKIKAACVLLLVLAAVLGLYRAGRWLEQRYANPEPRGDYQARKANEPVVTYNDMQYRLKKNITSVLMMGIDHVSGASGGQADFLQLLVIDDASQNVKRLAIDRDTMTPITVLGVLGNRSGIRTAQISLSHGFGDGKEQSCELTMEAVSNLLLGMPIDYYLAMNLDGIATLNDMAGGVSVTLEADYSALDPAMTKGTTLTLRGEQAEVFLRNRKNLSAGTNEARMALQEQYIAKLFEQMDKRLRSEQEFSGRLFDSLEPYLTTNISRGRLINIVWAARDYERMEPLRIAGEHKVGNDGFMQFYADEASLYEAVFDLFYEVVK